MLSFESFKYLVLGFTGVVIVGGSYAVSRSERATLLKHLGDRRPTSDVEFSAFFQCAAEAAIAVQARNHLKKYLSIPSDLVYPDDKLCADLGLAAHDGLDANFFIKDIERSLVITIPDAEAERMFTLRDIVSYIYAAKGASK